MTVSNLRTMMATAMLGAGLMSFATASAEEPGVVRISDGIKQMSAHGEVPPPAPLPADVTGEDHPLPVEGIVDNGYIYYGDDYKHGRQRARCWGRNALPPDYGFYPPTGYPYVWRQPVIYQRYLPDQLYGTPGMRYTHAVQPMVYMPTDTTQLGFNYMYVPQWLPNRANYPLAPNPVMWQRRAAPWPRWEDPYRARHKHRHVWKHQHDLIYHQPQPSPNEVDENGESEEDAPAPAIEASLETDAQI